MSANVVEAPPPEQKSLFTPAFWLLLVTQACFGMSFSAFFLLPKYLKVELAASDSAIGFVGAVGAIAGVVSFPLVGALNDRYGKRAFIILGCLAMTASALSMLGVGEVNAVLYTLRVVQGLAFALLFNSTTTLVSDAVAAERLGPALGVFGASMLATNALAPAISEAVAQRWGWQQVFLLSTCWAVCSIVGAVFVSEPPRERGPSRRAAEPLFYTKRARRVMLLTAVAGAGFGTLFTFQQPFALERGLGQVSGFFVAYAVFALFVRLLLMGWLDRFRKQVVSAGALALYALAIGATVFLRPGLLEPIGAATGLAHGVLYPVFNALAVEGVSAEQRGSMMALYHGGFNAGAAVALLGGGFVAEYLGYPTLFAGVGLITLLGAAMLARIDLQHERASG